MGATRSPPSSGTSPAEDERMGSRSASPPRGKREIVLHPGQGSPVVGPGGSSSAMAMAMQKGTPSPSSSVGRERERDGRDGRDARERERERAVA